MNTKLLAILVSSLSLTAMSGCNRAEAPADTAADVADARQDAAENVAEARRDAAETMGSAADEMRDANMEVEEARIDGERKVALERCETLAGDAQRACKDSAEATYESAMSRLRTQMSTPGAAGSAADPMMAPGTTATPATPAPMR